MYNIRFNFFMKIFNESNQLATYGGVGFFLKLDQVKTSEKNMHNKNLLGKDALFMQLAEN